VNRAAVDGTRLAPSVQQRALSARPGSAIIPFLTVNTSTERSHMPIQRLPESVAKLIWELGEQQKNPGEIAQMLNLKKVQVSTVLAHHRLQQVKSAELAHEEALEATKAQ
jgi:hypothetical protein